MAIHGLYDVGKVAEILDCNKEAAYLDEDVLGFLLQWIWSVGQWFKCI